MPSMQSYTEYTDKGAVLLWMTQLINYSDDQGSLWSSDAACLGTATKWLPKMVVAIGGASHKMRWQLLPKEHL